MARIRKLSFVALTGAALFSGHLAGAQTLRGSRASVELMYARAQEGDLDFMATPGEVYRAVADGLLEPLAFSDDLELDEAEYPFVLPTTRRFTDSLAVEYHSACGERLVVTSGVRPLADQPRNASPKSVHPTGMAVDFRKPRDKCLTWLRKSLLTLESRGLIEATEERRPAHFHVAVLRQRRLPQAASTASSATASSEPKAAPVGSDVAEKKTASSSTNAKSSPSSKSARNAKTSTASQNAKRPAVYTVRAGDNLTTIAKRHNTTPQQLQKLNGLRTTRITVGQRIKMPTR